jgi:ketosteroid isomerase-like protein
MKTLALVLIIILMSLLSCSKQDNAKIVHQTRKEELKKALSNFNTAFQKVDVSTLAMLITDNYLHSNGTSKPIGKKEWLNFLKDRKQKINAGKFEFQKYRMSEVEVELYDKMAILTAKIAATTIQNGKKQDNEYRVTQIWVEKSGTWKRAGFHDGKIK